jgi:Uma2 family endonuclease
MKNHPEMKRYNATISSCFGSAVLIYWKVEHTFSFFGGFMMANKKRPDQIREQPMTYDDYANMPDDGIRYELAGGQLEAMSPSPGTMHQLIVSEIVDMVKAPCNKDYLTFQSPIDVILSDEEVRQPDLLLVHRDRISIITKRGIEGAPDLVVEVLSPYSSRRDRLDKSKVYAKYGIPEYWIVDPSNESLEQYILAAGGYALNDVYCGDLLVHSERIACISFSMKEMLDRLPELPNL